MAGGGQTVIATPVPEGSTMVYTAVLTDDAGNAIGSAQVTALLLTVWSQFGNQVVNGIDHVNILNIGRGTLDTLGNLTVVLGPADMVILNTQGRDEVHTVVVEATYASGIREFVHAVLFTVQAVVHGRKVTRQALGVKSTSTATAAELFIP